MKSSNHKFRYYLPIALFALPFSALAATINCDVAIIGGGPGGTFMAYELTKNTNVTGVSSPSQVCLFEKKPHLGGRIDDIDFAFPENTNPYPTDNNVTGTGAYRFQVNHYTYTLMKELKVKSEQQASFSTLNGLAPHAPYTSSNLFGYSSSQFTDAYSTPGNQAINDDAVWASLLCGAQTKVDSKGCPQYKDMEPSYRFSSPLSYLNLLVNPNSTALFTDFFRFHADFYPLVDDAANSPFDTVSYMEYNARDWNTGPTRYAIPGFSALTNNMEDAIEGKGGRVYKDEAITRIDKTADGYSLTTSQGNQVNTKQVVIATTKGAVAGIENGTGNIIGQITAAPEYNFVQPVSSITITNKWSEHWWKRKIKGNSALIYPQVDPTLTKKDDPILRANTTITSTPDGLCINSVELPYTHHHNRLKVTRSAYVDIPACVTAWVALWNGDQAAALTKSNEAIRNVFRKVFPQVFDGTSKEPQLAGGAPSLNNTHFTYHPEGWYYLKKGAQAAGVTNQSVLKWSLQPVTGEKVYLVGDAWANEFSSWSNGAYMSAIAVLKTHFNITIAFTPLPNVHCADEEISDNSDADCQTDLVFP